MEGDSFMRNTYTSGELLTQFKSTFSAFTSSFFFLQPHAFEMILEIDYTFLKCVYRTREIGTKLQKLGKMIQQRVY